MKKHFLLSALILLGCVAVHAQSAEKISEIIKTKDVTYGQMSYLAGVYNMRVSDHASYEQSFEALRQAGLISPDVSIDDKIPLQEAAFLCADAAGVKGGLFYSLFHNPRYAYRELKAQGILPQSVDSGMSINGRDAIAILNGCIALTGGNEE
ncbi:MAG: hypothetical protein IJP62_09775 [Treponema sp.]|nr:hypothetical protein [Treponema sp.]